MVMYIMTVALDAKQTGWHDERLARLTFGWFMYVFVSYILPLFISFENESSERNRLELNWQLWLKI